MAIATQRLPIRIDDLDVKYDKDRPVPAHFPRLHFIGLICGSRGSGKTTAMLKFVQAYMTAHSFDKLYILSPTYDSDPKYKLFERMPVDLHKYDHYSKQLMCDIIAEIKGDLEAYKEYLRQKKLYQKWLKDRTDDVRTLDDRQVFELDAMEYQPPTTPWKRGPPTSLLIFDDLVGSDLYRSDCRGAQNTFFTQHRHFKTSVLFLTQVYRSGVPRQLRPNLSLLLLFANKNASMMKEIAEEYASYISVERFMEAWRQATEEPHGFLYCDFEAPKGERLRKNFEEAFVLTERRSAAAPP